MDLKEYQKLCQRTAREFSTKEKEIMTWGLGIAGEAGDGEAQRKGTKIDWNEKGE